MKKDPRIFIEHIIESIELIEVYSEELTTEKFKKSKVLQDAIIRRLEIIGEAVKNISLSFRSPWGQACNPAKQVEENFRIAGLTLHSDDSG